MAPAQGGATTRFLHGVASLRIGRQNSALFESEVGYKRNVETRFLKNCATSGGWILRQKTPTDNALATIASILDGSASSRELEKPEVENPPMEPERSDGDGYQKIGPGPMAAIRFKWTVRREINGEYYVDETIGENSTPFVSGPMSRDIAVKFVNDRESEARQRFEAIKGEMIGRSAATSLTREDNNEM